MDIENKSLGWGETVRTRRKALGLTQAGLASLAGCSHFVVVQVEKGRTNVRLDNVTRILNVLGLRLTMQDAGHG